MRKKYLLGVCLIVVLVSGCSKKPAETPLESSSAETTVSVETSKAEEPSPEEMESLTPNEEAKHELYEVLKAESEAAVTIEESSEGSDEKAMPQVDYSRCVLHDIDGDGVEECFLDTTDGLVMYTFSDQVVSKPISFSVGSDLYFAEDNDCFYVHTSIDSYEGWYCYSKGFDNESLYALGSREYDQWEDEDDGTIYTEVYIDGECVYGPDIEGYPDGLDDVMDTFKPDGVIKAEWSISLEDAFE